MFSRRTSWNLAPNAFTRALNAHRDAGRELLDLTASNPTHVGLCYETGAILQKLGDPGSLVYHPEPKGMLSARLAVAEYYREAEAALLSTDESQVDVESIILTVSTSEAYSFVFRLLCDPGDEILVPAPSYPLFEFLADLQDLRLTPYSLLYDHGWHIDFHSLESALTPRSRAIVVVHPNNPTGSYVKKAEREVLNRLCTSRNLALVADEVFLDYIIAEAVDIPVRAGATANHPAGLPPATSFACNPEVLTFTLSGVSKISGLPQMKLAWIVVGGPEQLATSAVARLEVIADTYLSMNAPVQLAAPTLLAQRHSINRQLLTRIRANLSELERQLALSPACSRLMVEGGWYVVVRVPFIRSDEELAIALLQQYNLLVQPGYFYDFASDGYVVLSLITPEAEFREGVRRLLQFVG
jgi:alanine-synthesizing transaminase